MEDSHRGNLEERQKATYSWDQDGPEAKEEEPAPVSRQCRAEWYNNWNVFGLRRAFPHDRTQISTVGGEISPAGKTELEPIVRKALDTLGNGVPEQVVKYATVAEYRALLDAQVN